MKTITAKRYETWKVPVYMTARITEEEFSKFDTPEDAFDWAQSEDKVEYEPNLDMAYRADEDEEPEYYDVEVEN